MAAMNSLLILILVTIGCGSTETPEAEDKVAIPTVEDDSLIEGMTPDMSPLLATLAESYDTQQLLKELQAALKRYPHEAKWKAGSRTNWVTFKVDFGSEFPADTQAGLETVWQEWTTPICELTEPEGAESLKMSMHSTLEQALQTGEAENQIYFRGFKFYVIAQRISRRNSENSFELQFLDAAAALEAGE